MREIQAWLNMLRVSNTPTMVSNVMVGIALGVIAHKQQWAENVISPRFSPLKSALIIGLALLCAYFGGLVLNDAADAPRDTTNRPDKPIPTGIINRSSAWLVGFSLLGAACLLSLCTQGSAIQWMLLLVGAVLAYTFMHHWLLPALVFMGICRGSVYVITMAAFDVDLDWNLLLVYTLGISWYTAMLTMIARTEHAKKIYRHWFVLLLLPAAFVPAWYSFSELQFIWIVATLVLFTLWLVFAFVMLRHKQTTVHGIHALLAGFCLLDCVYLSILGEVSLALISGICFLFTLALQRKVLGT